VKKIITTLKVAILTICVAFALTGCGEKAEPDPLENTDTPDPAKPDIPGEPEK